MTHKEALSARMLPSSADPNPRCTTLLHYYKSLRYDGVHWDVYWCPTCGVEIYTLNSTLHWSNHVAVG